MNEQESLPISAEDLCEALLKLRSDPGRLTVHKFARHPQIAGLYGDDLPDGYLAFKHELKRLTGASSKYEAAAAWSILAPADSVLDRLVLSAEQLASGGEELDQRTARRWSDRGMLSMAQDLVTFAGMRGTYGQDLIGITVGNTSSHLRLRVVQVVTDGLRHPAPSVNFPHTTTGRRADGEELDDRTVELEGVRPDHYEQDGSTLTRAWLVSIAMGDGDTEVKAQVMAHRVPTPVWYLQDETGDEVSVEFSVHRGMVEMTADVSI